MGYDHIYIYIYIYIVYIYLNIRETYPSIFIALPQLHRDGNTNMLVDRRKANLCNFMYKRKSNNILLQERPRPLRRFEAEVFIEHAMNIEGYVSLIFRYI